MSIEEFLSYENVKQFLVYAAFGSFVGLAICNIASGVFSLARLAWKSLKNRFGKKMEDNKNEQNLHL